MNPRGAADLAGWAIERWSDSLAGLIDLGLQADLAKSLRRKAQVYYVAANCQDQIAAAAKSLDVKTHLIADPASLDDSELGIGKAWILDPGTWFPITDGDTRIRDGRRRPVGLISVGIRFGGEFTNEPQDWFGRPGILHLTLHEIDGVFRDNVRRTLYHLSEAAAAPYGTRLWGLKRTTLDGDDLISLHPDFDFDGSKAALIALSFIVAANAFSRQRLIGAFSQDAGRGTRKRLTRDGNADLIQPVKVIVLRRVDRPASDGDGSPVEWSHRWLVDGHWRNQYHPSSGFHVPTWITAYVKGPADKPFVAKERRIAVVR